MKTIYQLLKLVKKEVIADTDTDNPKEMLNYTGLCSVMTVLMEDNIMTEKERDYLQDYLYKHKPRNNHIAEGYVHFWVRYRKALRLNWLDKHIALNKKKL